jgi:hypothetical protein
MKKIITSALVLLFVLFSISSFANDDKSTTLSVQGKVIDKNTGEALAGVSVIVAGEEVFTDFDGNFNINISLDESVEVSFISYKSVKIEAEDLNTKNNYVEIALEN